MALRILVFGRTGQVGSALHRLSGHGLQIAAIGRGEADLTRPSECAAVIGQIEADVVVNAAAYTAVDGAESDENAALTVNAEAPGAIAAACARRRLPLIHLSTDYVFSGRRDRPWREDDPATPMNVYGATKRLGEIAVTGAHPRAVILRTAWVHSPDGANFVRTMLRLGSERSELRVIDDQTGSPTAAHDIASALVRIAWAHTLGYGVPGIFHYCGAPATTWHGFANEIFRHHPAPPRLVPITTAEWPSPAERPRYTVMDCTRIRKAYGIEQPDWRESLADILGAMREAA